MQKAGEEEAGSVQEKVTEPPIVKEVVTKEGGTIDMNISEEVKTFARASLALVDPSLVLRDVKNFTAEVC